jgi:cobalt-zinc-cadmium resistance protein CzcA
LGDQSFDVRGVGLIRSVQDIGDITVSAAKGVPVRVRDVATVSVGAAPRLGIVGQDDEPDVVEGIVLMRYGGDSLKTIRGIHDRVDYIRQNRVLPPGIDIEPVYDRADLVKLTTHTVMENLLVGMILVSLVLWLFLGNVRAALITAINIPLALLFAFTGMVASGNRRQPDLAGRRGFRHRGRFTVIVMESIFVNFARKGGTAFERVVAAAREVGPPMFSSTLIIAVAFIPLFTLTGVAGVIMSPDGADLCLRHRRRHSARAHTYADAGFAPFTEPCDNEEIARKGKPRHALPQPVYTPCFHSRCAARMAIFIGVGSRGVALGASVFLGREFMPKLEEGNFWIRATLPISISLGTVGALRGPHARHRARLSQATRAHRARSRTAARPEVQTVISQLGRPDDGTDVSGFYNIELLAPLSPAKEWRKGLTKDG